MGSVKTMLKNDKSDLCITDYADYVQREDPPAPLAGSVPLILSPAIHMPAGIYPFPFAQHEYFSDAAGLVDPLAGGLELV